jgi:hypothetical protein
MPIEDVYARPERLQQLRVTAGGLADGLARRRGELADAIAAYQARTERAYEADCRGVADAVDGVGRAVRELGLWVGEVGDAFERLPSVFGELHLGGIGQLLAGLPPALQLEPADSGGRGGEVGAAAGALGLTVASAATRGATPSQLDVLAVTVGRESAVAAVTRAVDDTPAGPVVGRLLDLMGVALVGIDEGVRRWSSEPDRETIERLARATFDGLLAAGGTYGGATVGGGLATAACVPAMGPAAPGCGAVGSLVGGRVGRRVAEVVSDAILGDESEPWERDAEALADEIADVDDEAFDAVEPLLDEAEAEATEAADRHNDFILDHEWLWDDEHRDAPHHAPPPPAPDVPVAGPR